MDINEFSIKILQFTYTSMNRHIRVSPTILSRDTAQNKTEEQTKNREKADKYNTPGARSYPIALVPTPDKRSRG